MRLLLFMSTILLAAIGIGTTVQAQNYPWCAYYGGQMGGSSNCGFVSFEQCMRTLSGMGGFCARNNQYVPPRGGGPGYVAPHRHYVRRHWHD